MPASRPAPALQAPALVNATSGDDAVDDGDALPAVGKVWDTGPKRSLSEIFAAQAAKKAQPQEQAGPPSIATDLQPLWQSLLQRVQEQHGNAVYIPLMSGQPRREGDVLVIRLTGPFAHIGKVLEKYRDQLQTIASEVAGAPLGIRLELDAAAPAPAPTAAPGSAHRAGGPATNSPTQQSAISAAPARDGIPITPELRQELEKDPLIRSLLVEFNGTIVKVEQK